MGQKKLILILPFLIVLSLVGCRSNNENTQEKATENQDLDEKYSKEILNDTTDCLLLLEILKKECVALTARLNVNTLKKILILVPSDRFDLDCDQFTIGHTPVSVDHKSVTIDSIRSFRPKKDEPVRIFYLMDYKSQNGYKSIELLYSPSGGIYKIVVKIDGAKAIIEDFFCANF